MKKRFLIALLFLVSVVACALGLAACATVRVTSVTLNKTELTLDVGGKETLTATVLPDNASNKTVEWTSEDSDIATVSSGKITAVSEGATTVTATADGVSATCTVTVKKLVPARYIVFNKTRIVLWKDGEATIIPDVYPENYTSEIVWSVAPEGVVTVSDGKITALSQGQATVTATIDGKDATCKVDVTEDGLMYELNEDGQSYAVANNYAAKSSDIDVSDIIEINVASEYKGMPVTSIGRYAFQILDCLKKITIPASITEIELGYIYTCDALENITVDGANTQYASVDGILYNKAITEFVYVPEAIKGVITIPQTVTVINDSAFCDRKYITGIEMHDGITAIEEGAFHGCEGLRKITITENITEIGRHAFYCCYKLWEVYNLSDLPITTGSEDYGEVGLYAYNIFYSRDDVSGVEITQDGFVFCTTRESVYLVDYMGTESEVVLPENYNGKPYAIGQYAFYKLNTMTGITLPGNISSIGKSAFSGCGNLTHIIFNGTREQWTDIGKGFYWNENTGNYTVQCAEVKLDKNGNEIE